MEDKQDSYPKPRLTRISGPKVRTGCKTCKARRVKCDEGKPTCTRCADALKNCEGYDFIELSSARRRNLAPASTTKASKLPRNSKTLILPIRQQKHGEDKQLISSKLHRSGPLPPLVDVSQNNLTFEERRYLDFFRRITARTNEMYFYKPYWGSLVHQASEIQPAVRHAVIGVGSLHWGSMMDPEFAGSGQMMSFSLRQCSRALNHLNKNLADNMPRRGRMETVLVSCAILVALTFSQGDARANGCHVRAGFELLDEWQRVKMDGSPTGPVLLGTFYQPVLDWPTLVDDDDAGKKGYSYPHELIGGFQKEFLIEKPGEACGVLLILGWLVLQMKPLPSKTFPGSIPFAVLKRIRHWRKLILESAPRLSQEKQDTIAILNIWGVVLLIKGLTDDRISDGEMRYDKYSSHFEHLVRLAKELLARGSLKSLWEMNGIITPLFFCAFKCRDWEIRRQAVGLMRGWSGDQGIWSISKTYLVLDSLIAVESKGYSSGDTIPPSARIDAMRVEFLLSGGEIRFWYRRPVPVDEKDRRLDWEWNNEMIAY